MFRINRNCLFRYRSETTKTPKQKTEKNQKNREKNRKNRKTHTFSVKKLQNICSYQTLSVGLLFVSVQSKHRNSLFRYRSETTETNVLFRIVPKQVSVPFLVVSNRNEFRRTPYLWVRSCGGPNSDDWKESWHSICILCAKTCQFRQKRQ